MKVALCFNGQLRTYKDIYEYIERNVLSKFDTDIFFHTWDDPNLDDAVSLYKPKLYKSESLVNENYPLNRYPYSASEHFRKTTFFQFYSLFKSFQLKKEYEIQNNFTYDVVIRNRFDSAINFVPDLNNMEKDKIYLPSERMGEDGIICDYFAYGTSYIMDRYSSIYVNFDFLYNNGVLFNSEQMCFANLKLYNLVDHMVPVDMNHLFPPGRRGSCPHSFFPP